MTESSRSLEDRYLCSLMNSGSVEELKEYLERETSLDLTQVVDDQGYTLAHLATYHNSPQTLKLLCSYVRYLSKAKARSWRRPAPLHEMPRSKATSSGDGLTDRHRALSHSPPCTSQLTTATCTCLATCSTSTQTLTWPATQSTSTPRMWLRKGTSPRR